MPVTAYDNVTYGAELQSARDELQSVHDEYAADTREWEAQLGAQFRAAVEGVQEKIVKGVQEQLEADREQRVAHVQHMAVRRLGKQQLHKGWQTWLDRYLERRRSMRVMAAAAGRLRRPALSACLAHWWSSVTEAAAEAERAAMLAYSRFSSEAALARAALAWVDERAALEAEIRELRAKLGNTPERPRQVVVGAAAPSSLSSSPAKPKKESKLFGDFEIDEDSGVPIAEQLRQMLVKNAASVMDLFREWNGDGVGRVISPSPTSSVSRRQITRKEFRAAIARMGLDVLPMEVDSLFDSWDPTGDGTIDFKELQHVLRAQSPLKNVGRGVLYMAVQKVNGRAEDADGGWRADLGSYEAPVNIHRGR